MGIPLGSGPLGSGPTGPGSGFSVMPKGRMYLLVINHKNLSRIIFFAIEAVFKKREAVVT